MKYYIVLLGFLCAGLPAIAQNVARVESKEKVSIHADERGFLGIYSGEMNDDKARLLHFDTEYGSYVTKVIPNSGAAKAGLMPFDYVYGVNDKKVNRSNDITDLLDEYEPGDRVDVLYIRQGRHRSVSVVLGYRSSASYSSIPEDDQPFFGVSPHDDNDDDELGVRVEVIANSTAEGLGLQTGDLILALNDYPMIDWSDIGAAIDNMVPGRSITVKYERNGQIVNDGGPIKTRRETNRAIEEAKNQQPAFLGIYSEKLSEDKADKLGLENAYGSYVSKIIPGTPADEYGLRPFDVIYGVDEYRTGEYQAMGHILRKYHAGDEATLHIIREGKKKTLPFKFGSRPQTAAMEMEPCSDPFLGVRHSYKTNDMEGVGVTVVPNSTAEAIGLKDGDVITIINGYPILDWNDIGIAIDNMKVGEQIEVSYRRGQSTYEGKQPIKAQCETEEAEENISGTYNRAAPRRPLPENMDLEIENLTSQECAAIKRDIGLDLPSANNLRVEGLNLFPDPASGQFTLQFNLPNRGETSIKIFNSSGRLIYNYDLGGFSGEFNDQVDISQNGEGRYYIQVDQDGKSVSKKAILSRK